MRLHFNLFETGAASKIVKRDVAGPMALSLVRDPGQILLKSRGPYPCEPHPEPIFIKGKQTTAPPQDLARATHLIQIVDLLDLKPFAVCNHNVAIHGREINRITKDVSIVRALHRQRKVYNFPWQMALLMRVTRWLPDWLLARVMRDYNANPPMPALTP